MKHLKGRSQKEAAKLLGVKQPEISALMRAKFSRFSQERLIGFLNKLDRKVTIQISHTAAKSLTSKSPWHLNATIRTWKKPDDAKRGSL